MKVAELTGVLLDYWTARADGRTAKILKPGDTINSMRVKEEMCAVLTPGYDDWWQPFHVYWGSCGEILERERFVIDGHSIRRGGFHVRHVNEFIGKRGAHRYVSSYGFAKTMLVAAMHAYITSKFGAELPDEVPA
jgi:Protein of unknown function (DUF2591)